MFTFFLLKMSASLNFLKVTKIDIIIESVRVGAFTLRQGAVKTSPTYPTALSATTSCFFCSCNLSLKKKYYFIFY